ncbi:ABC transporter ATP-binding protein [soil metagenome]
MIRLQGVRFAFPGGFALEIPALDVAAGERLAISGPSGSGKTTLLNLIAGILRPEAGSVAIDGADLARLSPAALRDFRIRRLGFVFQHFALVDYLSVRDNILHPARLNPALALTPALRARAAGLADGLGIARHLDRHPGQLSHGEQQRVAIARSLIAAPALVLADEPTGNLDPANKTQILDLLFAEAKAAGATLIAVTHDVALLPRFDRVLDFADLARRAA